MNKNDENRVMYLLDCCDMNGKITLNKDDMLLILEYQRELGRADEKRKIANSQIKTKRTLEDDTFLLKELGQIPDFDKYPGCGYDRSWVG